MQQIKKKKKKNSLFSGGGVAEWLRALDLKSGSPWFKSSTLPLRIDLFSVVPSSTVRLRPINS